MSLTAVNWSNVLVRFSTWITGCLPIQIAVGNETICLVCQKEQLEATDSEALRRRSSSAPHRQGWSPGDLIPRFDLNQQRPFLALPELRASGGVALPGSIGEFEAYCLRAEVSEPVVVDRKSTR